MTKLLVFMERVNTKGLQSHCYVFDFRTNRAARDAASFFIKQGCKVEIISDVL